MALAVIAPAPVTDLIELASVKSRLGISDSSEDALLAEYIDEVCSLVRKAFGRELARQRYTETFYPRTTACELILSCNPVDPDSISVTINGEAVATDTYELRDAGAGLIYRASGWPASSSLGSGIAITYKGGFLIPGSATGPGYVTTWEASKTYAVGAWVRTAALSPLRLECTTGGASGSTEPVVPAAGATVADGAGALVWTARHAEELPLVFRRLAAVGIRDHRDSGARPAGLTSSEGDGFSETYSAAGSTSTGASEEWLTRLLAFGQEYRRQ